mgnify:CR=1 FL=1
MTEVENYSKEFDDLIRLLRKMKKMSSESMLDEMDSEFINECDILLENHDLIKSTLSPDLITVVGKPLFDLVKEFLLTLKEDLLQVYRKNNGNPEMDEITEIDDLLNKSDLSIEEIDSILDKRIALMEKVKLSKI